ncbi:MAG: hypothetical protein ACFFAM_19435 [Promethearchaeota archaeon]
MQFPVIFRISDQQYLQKTLVNILILIGWLTLVSDLVPIFGLLTAAFLSMTINIIVIFMYKSKKWNIKFRRAVRWMFLPLLILGLLFFFLYLVSEKDFMLILARPFNLLEVVPAIPITEKLGYFFGFLTYQIMTVVIFTIILSQRRKVIWNIDNSNQMLLVVFHHPLYQETRSIHFKDISEIEFGAASPFKRLFTNTQEISITRTDTFTKTHEISLTTTPIFLMMCNLIKAVQILSNNEKVTFKWFRELGDYLQNSIFTKYKIKEELTLPLPITARLIRGKKFITETSSKQQLNEELISHPIRGAVYRTRLGTILFAIIGLCCIPVSTVLVSYFLKLGYQSVFFPEAGFNYGFNAEILIIGGLFLIILFAGFRLLYISIMMLFGKTTLQWTESEFLIGVQWRYFNRIDIIIPYALIWDVFPLLESISSGLSKLWVETPFITLPFWIEDEPNSALTFKILVNTIHFIENHSK